MKKSRMMMRRNQPEYRHTELYLFLILNCGCLHPKHEYM